MWPLKKLITKLRTLPTRSDLNRILYEQRRNILEEKILNSNTSGITDKKYCDNNIIVSLTTYGRRLDDVCFTIESIMQQTFKPNRIVLWIDPLENGRQIPESLILQQKRGLEIKVEPSRIRSYTKLIPSLRNYPEDVIITVDDDMLYDFDLVERLIKSYLTDPTAIHAARTHVITFKPNGTIDSYNKWKACSSETDNPNLIFFTGVGGVLYPPGIMDEEVLNDKAFMSLAPKADDVWFNAMALKKGSRVIKIMTRSKHGDDFLTNESVQDMGLWNTNTGALCENDLQIQAVYNEYSLMSKLNEKFIREH